MPLFAVRLRGLGTDVVAPPAATHVLGVRYRLEVVGAHACPGAARVVKFEAIRHWTVLGFPGINVGEYYPTVPAPSPGLKAPVALSAEAAEPEPAAFICLLLDL